MACSIPQTNHESFVTSAAPWVSGVTRAEHLHNRALDRGTNSHRYAGRLTGITRDDAPLAAVQVNETVGSLHRAIEHLAGPEHKFDFDDRQHHAFQLGQEFRLHLNSLPHNNGEGTGKGSDSIPLNSGEGSGLGVETFATIVKRFTACGYLRYQLRAAGHTIAITQAQLIALTGLENPVGAQRAAPESTGGVYQWRNVPINIMPYHTGPWCQPHTPQSPVGTASMPSVPVPSNGVKRTIDNTAALRTLRLLEQANIDAPRIPNQKADRQQQPAS